MRELEKKQKIKTRMYSTPALIALAIVVGFIIKGTYDVVEKMNSSKAYVSGLEARVETLKSRETELKRDIDKLETTEGVDNEIKGKFSVSKEGEHVAVIIDARNAPTTTATTTTSWLGKIWRGISSLWQ
jgi:cell division protein FtsB